MKFLNINNKLFYKELNYILKKRSHNSSNKVDKELLMTCGCGTSFQPSNINISKPTLCSLKLKNEICRCDDVNIYGGKS